MHVRVCVRVRVRAVARAGAMARATRRENWGLRVRATVYGCVWAWVCTGEGGGGGIFVGECGKEVGGMVVGVCVGVGVGVGMRVPVVSGTSVGQLVPFCGVNVAPGVQGMPTGGGFWVLVVWSSHTPPVPRHLWIPLGQDRRGGPRSHSICDCCAHARVAASWAFFGKYVIEAVDFGCEFSVAGRCDSTH